MTTLLAQILNKPGVSDEVNNYLSGQSVVVTTLLNRIVDGLRSFAVDNTQVASVLSGLKKGIAIKEGRTIVAFFRSYLSGQRFATLDQYVNVSLEKQITTLIKTQAQQPGSTISVIDEQQIAEEQITKMKQLNSKQVLIRTLWDHAKAQIVIELFRSQANFEREYAANQESAQSVLLDEGLRSVLGLARESELSKAGYAAKGATALAKAAINTTLPIIESVVVATVGPAITNIAVSVTKVVANKIHSTASIPLSYIAGTIWNFWGSK